VTRQWLATGAALVALSSVLAACSGGSDDEPKADPSKTATSSAPEPTTPAPAPTPAAQPQGANGVTYEIQNWDEYASDPAVLAWKQTIEGFAGSIGAGKVLEPVRAGMAKRVLRDYVRSFDQATDNNWHVEPVAKVKVESAETTADRSRLVVCLWAPSTAFIKENGEPAGDSTAEDIKVWSKQNLDMVSKDGRWVISTFKYDGECSGGAPA
jgi:hypothetical protein